MDSRVEPSTAEPDRSWVSAGADLAQDKQLALELALVSAIGRPVLGDGEAEALAVTLGPGRNRIEEDTLGELDDDFRRGA